MSQFVRVNVTVTDLRSEPIKRKTTVDKRDPLQESQCLYAEKLRVLAEEADWLYVEALDQVYFKDGSWKAYPGWVEKSSVLPDSMPNFDSYWIQSVPWSTLLLPGSKKINISFATKLPLIQSSSTSYTVLCPNGQKARLKKNNGFISDDLKKMSEETRRIHIVDCARLFLGAPYFWGGRGAQGLESGVDCSGLVHLCYRVMGLQIPRNAKDQYLYCQKKTDTNKNIQSLQDLKTADLIFLANKDQDQDQDQNQNVNHVMLNSSNAKVIEATGDSNCVREINLKDRSLKASNLLFCKCNFEDLLLSS